MPRGIDDYFNLVHQPLSRIFYDIIYAQLDVPYTPVLKILDYGSGFGITAAHYAKHHEVVAVEPDTAMSSRAEESGYRLIIGGSEALTEFADGYFDLILCHNVLEYADRRAEIVAELSRVLKRGGQLSVVKHNRLGRAMALAVFDDNPGAALGLLHSDSDEASMFGRRGLYEISELEGWARGLSAERILGVRAFYALSHNSDVKTSPEWYENMLRLELEAGQMSEYLGASFFHHIIMRKN